MNEDVIDSMQQRTPTPTPTPFFSGCVVIPAEAGIVSLTTILVGGDFKALGVA